MSRESLDINPLLIYVERNERQRKTVTIDDLIPSITARGVLQPIIVEPASEKQAGLGFKFKLIAGERRLTTVKFLKLDSIPARMFSNLSELERQTIEFEENVRRNDLTWQDRATAAMRVHRLHKAIAASEGNPDWTETRTAETAGFNAPWFLRSLDVAEALEANDPAIANCDSLSAASTILVRRKARRAADVVDRVMNLEAEIAPMAGAEISAVGGLSVADVTDNEPTPNMAHTGGKPATAAPSFAIECADMMATLPTYSGKKFNLLHCDLPYGVPLNGQANQGAFEGGGYESSPDIYWALLDSLATNWDKFMYSSSHVMFWISMEFYEETLTFFERNFPQLKMQRTPLIWAKTDNKGIIPDALRGPRRIYEACLFGSSNDRKIVKPVGNAYPCPSAKEIHTNEKPQPMLNHFLSMFVDESTRIIDPTCGSGSAIRAAATLGASAGLGLEFNPEFASRASKALETQIKLAALAGKIGA